MTTKKTANAANRKTTTAQRERVNPYRYREFPISPGKDPKTKETYWRVQGHGDFRSSQDAETFVDQLCAKHDADTHGRV